MVDRVATVVLDTGTVGRVAMADRVAMVVLDTGPVGRAATAHRAPGATGRDPAVMARLPPSRARHLRHRPTPPGKRRARLRGGERALRLAPPLQAPVMVRVTIMARVAAMVRAVAKIRRVAAFMMRCGTPDRPSACALAKAVCAQVCLLKVSLSLQKRARQEPGFSVISIKSHTILPLLSPPSGAPPAVT
jgi:hypothetical protein